MTTPEPLITAVIPTYRRPKLLRRAIHSVLNQTYPHFQVCVYDNASGDETEAVVTDIAHRDPRVHYHRHSENIGLVRNFAYGAAQVSTPFLNFFSDDDLLLPKFFETAMAAFERHPSAAMFVGVQVIVAPDGKLVPNQMRPWKSGFYEPPLGFVQWLEASFKPIGWTSSVFRTTGLGEVGGLDISAGPFFDCDLMLKMTARYPIASADVPCAVFFHGGASTQLTVRHWCDVVLRTKASIEADPTVDSTTKGAMWSALNQALAAASFRWALGNAAKFGRLDDARVAAEIIRQFTSATAKAQVADLFGSNSLAGKMARSAFRGAMALRLRATEFAGNPYHRQLCASVREALAAASPS